MMTLEANRIADTFLMALCLWREARNQSYRCREAVACSVMNRVLRPSWWGGDVQTVVTKKWQYSSFTDPHDKQLTFFPQRGDLRWLECLTIAEEVIAGRVVNPVPGADSYYDDSIPPPKWATPETFVAKIERIIFHNLDRDVESPAASKGA